MHKHTSYTPESQLCCYSYVTYLLWLLKNTFRKMWTAIFVYTHCMGWL